MSFLRIVWWPIGIINPPFKNPGAAPCTLSLLQKRLQQLLLDHVLEILKTEKSRDKRVLVNIQGKLNYTCIIFNGGRIQ